MPRRSAPRWRRRRPKSDVRVEPGRRPGALPAPAGQCVLKLPVCCPPFVMRDARCCEGFRMPADRGGAAGAEGRRPKASREGTRGGGRLRCGVYGNLTVAAGWGRHRGPGRWRWASAWLAEGWRAAWRRERSRAPKSVDVGAIGGPGRRVDRTRVWSGCRRRRRRPAGLRCGEAVLGIMRPRS